MRTLKSVSTALITVAIMLGLSHGAAWAGPSNSGGNVDNGTVDAFRSFLVENGVSHANVEVILENFQHGRLPDSATGGKPVRIEQIERDDTVVQRAFYADGSVSVSGREVGSADVGLRSVSSCSVSSGSGYVVYRNCLIFGGNGLVGMSFHANYQIVQGGYDSITWHGAPGQGCMVTCDTPYFAGMKANENSGGAAYAVYYMRVTYYIPTRTSVLTLNVGSDSAWTNFTL